MKYVVKTAILLMLSCTGMAQKKTTLAPNDFEKAIQSKTIQLVDVRRPDEFKEGHLKGAVEANWQDPQVFAASVTKLDKTKPVYVYCLAGVRSDKAADWLLKNGFIEVINLQGGYQSWTDAGKPVVK